MSAAKIIEVMGSSSKSFDDAINEALKRVTKTVRNVKGAKIIGQTLKIENGKIVEYRVNLKVSFEVE